MKKALMLIAMVVMLGGCTARDGASTAAASLSSGFLSVFGVQDSYGDMKEFWGKEPGWDDTPKTTLSAKNSTKPIAQNQ